MEAAIFILALIVVMLVVPWMMGRALPARDAPSAGDELDANAVSRPLFTSDRERRLWFWVVAVVVAIYSTLGLAQELTEALRERNLLRVTLAVVVLLVVFIFARLWLKRHPGRREIGVMIGVTAVYLMVVTRAQSTDPNLLERTHIFEYGLVAILIYQALTERVQNGRRVVLPAVLAVAATALLGWLDEGIQALLPNRVYDIVDVGFNALAGLMAIVASVVLSYARRRDRGGGRKV